MAAVPTYYPEWATDSQYDPSTGFANKIEILKQFRKSGLKRNQYYFQEFHNTESALVYEWIRHLAERSAVDDVVYATTGQKVAGDIQDQYGGTWVLLGTSGSIDYFERTA